MQALTVGPRVGRAPGEAAAANARWKEKGRKKGIAVDASLLFYRLCESAPKKIQGATRAFD